MAVAKDTKETDGWQFSLPDEANCDAGEDVEGILELAAAAARGEIGRAYRRSRYATTFRVSPDEHAELEAEAFIKLLDAPWGLRRVKAMWRGSSAEHVAQVTRELTEAGFSAAPVLACGREGSTGRTMIITRRAAGGGLLRLAAAKGAEALAQKRAVLRALGVEVARLHRAGFVHGDLTPYNVLVVRGEPPRFVFLDHERTYRAFWPGRRRPQLRNLVQLGRFDLPGLSRTDRMRVLCGYVDKLDIHDRHSQRVLMKRVIAMLSGRLERDSRIRERDRG
jgi:Lipopolysaccharide kinase (Kdo/WaaP) family